MNLVGRTVGNIRLESLLGRGGMGEVYRGFDEKLQRAVAVKTIRAENRLSGTARSRFLREARILSRLAHPSICQVYDLIESDDADFLVLEFVEGQTLEHLRIRRRLEEREVLELAVKIVEPLAVAHREHIIHRDLKPQNIMLTPDGRAKVLDFGIARSTIAELALPISDLEPIETREAPHDPERTFHLRSGTASSSEFSGALTEQGSVVGTVLYMSPEQAAGRELSEASDMFSIGIVLQELLTGAPVYPPVALPLLIFRVADNESYPVTGVDPEIARLVEDLKHPTPARRPTAVETLERLRYLLDKPNRLRRRRLKVAVVTGAFALLSIVLAVVSWLALSEKRARTRAEELALERDREAQRANREATTANRVVEFLVGLFEEADPEKARGREVSVKEIVAAGGRRIGERLVDEPLVQARLQETLGSISWKLGDFEAAASLLATARATVERERGGDDPALAELFALSGAVAIDQGRFDEAAKHLARAERIFERMPAPPVEDRARTFNYLGALADAQGDLDGAERHYRDSLQLLRTQPEPPARDLALLLNNLAVIAWRRADYRAAEAAFRESLALNEELLGADHPHLAAQLNNLGILSRDLGDFAESERLHGRALTIAEKALGPEHPDVASILNSLARLYGRQERIAEGKALLERALEICRAAYGRHAETATTLLRLGDFERRSGQLARAAQLIPSARATLAELLGAGHPRLVEAWTAEGRLRLALGQPRAARDAFVEARRVGILALGEEHPDVQALDSELARLVKVGETAPSGALHE
jgi:serine/threonine-protein kinase